MASCLPSSRAASGPRLAALKDQAVRAFSTNKDPRAYTSPLFLRRFLELQLPELSYDTKPDCSSHTMLLLPSQTFEKGGQSFLSILCADCRHHFHVGVRKGGSRDIDDAEHPSHMLIPLHGDSQNHQHETGHAEFVCAADDCFYTVDISVITPQLTTEQIRMLQDDSRIFRNLKLARAEDPQRYLDIPDTWAAGSAITTLAKYLEDRLAKPVSEILKIKKRNKRFCVAFGTDFDDLLRSLGFEEKIDEEGEECWYITAPEPLSVGSPCPVHTRRAQLQNALEELRTVIRGAATTPAWTKLKEAIPWYLYRPEARSLSTKRILAEDLDYLGCLEEFPPRWFSWAALLLAGLCPSRRDVVLDAGLRCIQERNEDASLSIIMYKSKFDQTPAVDPQVQAAFELFGASLEDGKDPQSILKKFQVMMERDTSDTLMYQGTEALQIISNHLGADLMGDLARGESLATYSSSMVSNKRRMSVGTACRLLGVDTSIPAEMMRDYAFHADDNIDRSNVIAALEVLSKFKYQEDEVQGQILHEAAIYLRATENIEIEKPKCPFKAEELTTVDATMLLATPPGLNNIGNTCYLNSLLQYFYNVRPVREMVLNYGLFQLGLDPVSVSSRRTGGSGTPVTLEEAIVALQFIEELRQLFSELQTTKGAAGNPSQKLANTALSSAKEILTSQSQSQSQPPPLPARPSPVPPSSPEKEATVVNVTVEPVGEQDKIVSSRSSQTLVNELDDAETEVSVVEQPNPPALVFEENTDDAPTEVEALSDKVEHIENSDLYEKSPPLTLEQKISQISNRLEQSERSGTSQQDVGEIIGNILEHLMRAIRPRGPMEGKPEYQADNITELFFTTIVNSTIKTTKATETTDLGAASAPNEDVLNEEVVPERWITAFPHPDTKHKIKNNLYEALDRYFSYELLADGSLARYTTIRALPPIVHICIQRSDASGVKNKNPVIIPEILYLDRYMEAEAGSDLWNTRRRVWAVKERINELESRPPCSVENMFISRESHTWDNRPIDHEPLIRYNKFEDLIDFGSELWSDVPQRNKRTQSAAGFNESAESEPYKRRPLSLNTETGYEFAKILWEGGRRADEATSNELADLRREEESAFNSMKQQKYCLHAIICHGGGMNAGHYWVWVRDFKNQFWYKYNDSRVTRDSRESQRVIDELNDSGDPYYVAYVRDELKGGLVEVPQRTHAAVNTDDPSNQPVDEPMAYSIAIDTPPQPANSPVNTPVPEAVMGDAPALELQPETNG